jgi:hypothetical protein
MFVKNAEINSEWNKNIVYDSGDFFFWKSKLTGNLIEGVVVCPLFHAGDIQIYKVSMVDEDSKLKIAKIDAIRMIPDLDWMRHKKIKKLGI